VSLATFIQASAHDMPQVETGSVQCIVTSPPYYGLRAYAGDQGVEWPAVEYAPMPGLAPIRIAGCDPECDHEWQDGPERDCGRRDGKSRALIDGSVRNIPGERGTASEKVTLGAYCAKCGGWRGGLGNEPTLEAYIGHLVLCLREWGRVLRDDGIVFCNLGDSYSGSGGAGGDYNEGGLRAGQPKFKAGKSSGLKPKDLMLVPARFALAAQADGWWLRSDIIGAKVAPMPESVTDRPTRSHEHIWMLTKAARYYWDAEAVREAYTEEKGGRVIGRGIHGSNQARGNDLSNIGGYPQTHAGRNMRDVIEWRPAPFSGSHFAVFPEAIPERFIRAATSERGACPHCGAPWARVVEREKAEYKPCGGAYAERHIQQSKGKTRSQAGGMPIDTVQTVGFTPTCTCPAADPVPCVVLDPFSGSGTTAKVAVRLGRRAIGVDIAAEYLTDVTAQRFGAGIQMELTGAA